MAIPAQAQAKADEANAMLAQLRAGQEGGDVDIEIVEEDTTLEIEDPSINDDDFSFLTDVDEQVEQETILQEDTDPAQDDIITREMFDKSEHKYSTLQGKYNKELRELREANNVLSNENSELKGQTSVYQQMNTQQPKQEGDPYSYIPESIRSEYDPELLDVASRIADYKISASTADLKAEFEELKQGQAASTEKAEIEKQQAEFYRRLDSLAPNWRQIDKDVNFIKWQNEEKDVYGTLYFDSLNSMFTGGNIDGAAAIFNMYTNGMGEGEGTQSVVHPSQISPPKSASSNKTIVKKKQDMKYTLNEIQAFKKQTHLFLQGKAIFRGRKCKADEASKLSRDMARAALENRISL